MQDSPSVDLNVLSEQVSEDPVTEVKALKTMARGQYNLNIAAAQQSDEVGMRKRNLSMVDDKNTSKVEQITEILVGKKWSGVFSSGALETFFEW